MGRARSRRRPGDSIVGLIIFLLVFLFVLYLIMKPHPKGDGRHSLMRQRAQLNSIDTALELFNSDFDHYPPSEADDPAGLPYCGAMKMTEALMGQDLLGFHSNSIFRRDGLDAGRVLLYPSRLDATPPVLPDINLKARKGPFLGSENANAWRLEDIYGQGKTGPFPGNTFVLCDVFERKRPSDKRTGMPILYYRAHPGGTAHDVDSPDNPQNIYSYKDNLALIDLGVPGDPNAVHPLAEPRRFYLNTRNDKATGPAQPWRKDSFILISAGWDGLYGTADDICNFEWRYHER